MKKILLSLATVTILSIACTNTNTVNVPATNDSNQKAVPPPDTASNFKDSAKTVNGHGDTSSSHRY